MIHLKTVYVTRGEQFDTLKKAIEYRESLIEQWLRKVPGFNDIPAKRRIEFVQHIIDNRQSFAELCDYTTCDPEIDE